MRRGTARRIYLIEVGVEHDLEFTAMIDHSDPRTTKAIYRHLFRVSREKLVAKLDSSLSGVAGASG
jgi:hypothetical protein